MDFSADTAFRLAGILIGALALQFGRRAFINRIFSRLGREDQGRVIALREITHSGLRWAIWLAAVLVALATLGVDVGALIALFGVAGLAISFGAQSFIKDLISYVVFVFADNFRIGEEVLMDGRRGRIVKFEVGSVVLECDAEGESSHLAYVPYGSIATVENFSRSREEA